MFSFSSFLEKSDFFFSRFLRMFCAQKTRTFLWPSVLYKKSKSCKNVSEFYPMFCRKRYSITYFVGEFRPVLRSTGTYQLSGKWRGYYKKVWKFGIGVVTISHHPRWSLISVVDSTSACSHNLIPVGLIHQIKPGSIGMQGAVVTLPIPPLPLPLPPSLHWVESYLQTLRDRPLLIDLVDVLGGALEAPTPVFVYLGLGSDSVAAMTSMRNMGSGATAIAV